MYHQYLYPGSTQEIPRTTAYRKRKRQEQSRSEINYEIPCLNDLAYYDIEDDRLCDEQLCINDDTTGVANNDVSNDASLNLDESNGNIQDGLLDEELFDEEDTMTVIDANNDIPNNEDILGQDGRSKNYLNEKLCNCTCTTKGEAVLMALHLAKRHSLTWVAVLDILKMLNKLYDDDILPASKYTLFKNFSVQDISYKYHIFCTNCETYLGIRINLKTNELFTCNNCCATFHEQSGSYFVTLNLTAQIRNLLNDPTIQQNIQYRFQRTREVDVMSDIYDGAVYSSLERPGQPLHDNWNLSYTFNTDGCQPSKSSKMSVWPIYVMIHELTPELRSKHILLAGLWVHKNQPNMNLFLNPFITEANVLATEGIKWHYNNREIITKVLPICCCVDSAARCTLLCMKKFNGSYGCTFCEHPTKSVNGYTKYPISVDVPPDRTDETIRESMMKYLTDNPIPNDNTKGVKGPSVLMNLQHFDMVKGMVPDYMHSVLLGVTKFHTEILLTSIGEPYYAGSPNNIRIINQRLNAIVLPSSITRYQEVSMNVVCGKLRNGDLGLYGIV